MSKKSFPDDQFDDGQIGEYQRAFLFMLGCLHRLAKDGVIREGETVTLTPKGMAMFDQMVADMGANGKRAVLEEQRSCLIHLLTNTGEDMCEGGE